MNKSIFFIGLALCLHSAASAEANGLYKDSSYATIALEPFSYKEDFEHRMLGAWASYPHWQDIAYDQNFRVNEVVPGDPNIAVVQKVTPYTSVDNYAGAQKLMDIFLVPGSSVQFRYYLKTNKQVESYKVRFAAGELGKLDYTINAPVTNKWVQGSVRFEDIVKQNPSLAGKQKVKVYALAFLAKIPDSDPDMPIYLAIDDISVQAAKAVLFRFAEPVMEKLPEFETYIPKKGYRKGDQFRLEGQWPLEAKKVIMEVMPFTQQGKQAYRAELVKSTNGWQVKPFTLNFPVGLYIAKLTAINGSNALSETSFTIHILPESLAGKHPRLLFNAEEKAKMDQKFREPKYKALYAEMLAEAREQREKVPVKSLIFDLDQFPDENWLPTWAAWGSHIYHTGEALRSNACVYAFHKDAEAGKYVKDILVTLAKWPNWTHPWQTRRGRFSEHRTGSWSHRVAEAYDLVYDVMSDEERKLVREAIMKNIVEGVHKTYVVDDNITAATSNWLAMAVGGSLMNMAAIYDDGPETENLESYFTGAMFKYYRFLNRVVDSTDGAWGEGYGYNNYSLSNLSFSMPAVENVFNVDVAHTVRNSFNEYIWGGLIKSKTWFEYGDSGGHMGPATNWAYLLDRFRDPKLSWFYQYFKKEETYEDVVYDVSNIPQDEPFDESPVKVFREVGTTVFKSGWDSTDMAFIMRTGAFYNHQHIDQGSFWFADKGKIFIEERHLHNSNYYDDPIYQSWLTQPIGHSTILVNGNHQSQRVGDHLKFAPGFNDHAFIAQFLDGRQASFSSGDIGKLYWGKVKSLTRNVLFLKPRTVLMLDVAAPAEKDADISLLYQTAQLQSIKAGEKVSTITKEGETLNIMHLSPAMVTAKAVETPHYLKTLLNDRPLIKEGMLTVTARTEGKPLVMANILSTEPVSGVTTQAGNGFVSGKAQGKSFMFSTNPGQNYGFENLQTDALCAVWNGDEIFVSLATNFSKDGTSILSADSPVTFEKAPDGSLHYYIGQQGTLRLGVAAKPKSVTMNGASIKNYIYDAGRREIKIDVKKGEGKIVINR